MAEPVRFVGNCIPPKKVDTKNQINSPTIQDLADNIAKKLIGHEYVRDDGSYVPVRVTVVVDVVPTSIY